MFFLILSRALEDTAGPLLKLLSFVSYKQRPRIYNDNCHLDKLSCLEHALCPCERRTDFPFCGGGSVGEILATQR